MIVKTLMTRGTFVLAPGGRFGMVRRFNRRTNESLVQFGATGMIDAMVKGGLKDDYLRDQGMAADFHFTKLRLAPKHMHEGMA